MAETNLQKNVLYSSQEDIIYTNEQSNSALKCPICHRVFRDPIITQCGHTFCRKCISTTSRRFMLCLVDLNLSFVLVLCPYDEQILQPFVSNHIVAEQIDSLLVWCKYAFIKPKITDSNFKNERDEHGCPVKIPLIKKKQHEDECIYRFVSCPNGCLLNNLRQK
ncbi:unnamed protein product, partial [Rotaria sp. Silwood2]